MEKIILSIKQLVKELGVVDGNMILILFSIFIILNILDILTTNKVLSQGGHEENWAMKWLMDKTGKYWGYYKILLVVVVVGLSILILEDLDMNIWALGILLDAIVSKRLKIQKCI